MDDITTSPLEPEDIDSLIELQARTWQHYFLKERNMEVALMKRTRKNIEYYMDKRPGRILVAESGGKIAGSVVCHVWGSVGWFGPFEVRPELQNRGVGKKLASAATRFLEGEGCDTVGLETMASSNRNVGFYAKLGFKPKKLSYVLHKDLAAIPPNSVEISPRGVRDSDLPKLRKIWDSIHPGLDYSVEVESTQKFELGVAGAAEDGDLLAHVLFHDYELIEGSDTALVKLLVAKNLDLQLLDWCESKAIESGKKGIFVRFYQGNGTGLGTLLKRGYKVAGTLVRMQSRGPDEDTELSHISCWSG